MLRWLKKAPSGLGRAKEAKNMKAINNDSSRLAKNITTTSPASTEQENRYYIAQPDELLGDGRYEAIRKLGTGQYSHVWLAKDLQYASKTASIGVLTITHDNHRKNSYVALKLLTSDCYGKGRDIFEIQILEKIAQQQRQLPRGAEVSHVVGLLDSFRLWGPAGEHNCLVMPVLGTTLGRQVHRFPNRRIPVNTTKVIVKQLLTGLAFLHDNCKVVHTDLQPANTWVEIGQTEIERMVSDESMDSVTPTINEAASVKIIDFGVASWVDRHLTDHIQPEHVGAPEVILGAPWGPPVDIWSLGCLVIEFVKGHLAFPGEASPHGSWSSAEDHLAQYMEVIGPIPHELLERGSRTRDYFDDKGVLFRIPELQITSLENRIDGKEYPFKRPADLKKEEVPALLDFLRGSLALDPQNRSTAQQLLQHEWLRI